MARRYSAGCTNAEKARPCQRRLKMRASRSTTRSMGRLMVASLLQRAPGEGEEHVLERAPPHVRRLDVDPAGRELLQRGVAVARVDDDPVGHVLDAITRAVGARQGLVVLARIEEAELDHLARR